MALTTQCSREYHPADFGAAVVRERFCGCFSAAVAKSSNEPKSPTEASTTALGTSRNEKRPVQLRSEEAATANIAKLPELLLGAHKVS